MVVTLLVAVALITLFEVGVVVRASGDGLHGSFEVTVLDERGAVWRKRVERIEGLGECLEVEKRNGARAWVCGGGKVIVEEVEDAP